MCLLAGYLWMITLKKLGNLLMINPDWTFILRDVLKSYLHFTTKNAIEREAEGRLKRFPASFFLSL